MFNLNSPTVQYMLNNTPPPPMSNMPVTYGNTPRVETVTMPSPRTVQVSPYPDPYNMITGVGLSNYMPMPVYNFGGALSSSPPPPGYNGVPEYRDINQPVMGGLPIQGYNNPYMSSYTGGQYAPMVGGSYFNNYWSGNNEASRRYYRYVYASPEDRAAMDMGFEDAADMQANDLNIITKLAIMAKTALGESQEVIQEIQEKADVKIKELNEESLKRCREYNPFDLTRYQHPMETSVKCTAHIMIKRGDEIIFEVNKNEEDKFDRRVVNKANECERTLQVTQQIREKNITMHAYMYSKAPERDLDKMSMIDFFNEGFGIIHYYDRQKEWNKAQHDVTKLFDSDKFKRDLRMNYGTPQARRRIAREDALNFRTKEQEEKDKAAGLVRGGYGYLPGGIPLDKGVNPNIGSAIAVDKDGGLHISLPPELDSRPPLLASTIYSERLDTARDRFINDVNRRYPGGVPNGDV